MTQHGQFIRPPPLDRLKGLFSIGVCRLGMASTRSTQTLDASVGIDEAAASEGQRTAASDRRNVNEMILTRK